jgi:hypothetical protein
MNTDAFTRTLNVAHQARAAAIGRRRRDAELKALFGGAKIVITGLLMAALYGLLTHQIPL